MPRDSSESLNAVKACKGAEVWGDRRRPNSHSDGRAYAAENAKLRHACEGRYLRAFAKGCLTKMGELLRTLG